MTKEMTYTQQYESESNSELLIKEMFRKKY